MDVLQSVDSTAAPVVRLHGVSQHYGKTQALDDVSLDLPAGCMVGLIGPDGVGKSSLFALLAGARVIQEGHIEVLGGDLDRRPMDVAAIEMTGGDQVEANRMLGGTLAALQQPY